MKNLQYFPFERNRYYYGKLLTEQDFNSEQRYFNDKRRIINRFLHGAGVAAGLQVVRIDEKSISLEAGFALDGAGREIVVERPAVMRLEQIDGFSAIAQQKGRDFVYLCIEYEEMQTMPSHNLASHSSIPEEKINYDKCKEGYHLYLTDRPLENDTDTLEHLFLQKKVIYEDPQICIVQEYPRFVSSGKEFKTVLIMENRGSAKECSIDLEETLTCASCQGKNHIKLSKRERLESCRKARRHEITLKAFSVDMGEVQLSLDPERFHLCLGGKEYGIEQEIVLCIPVITKPPEEALAEMYFHEKMNQVLTHTYPSGIYLAKLFLIQSGQVYLLDEAEPMPFNQYIYPSFLTMGLMNLQSQEEKAAGKERQSAYANHLENHTEEKPSSAEGSVEIPLGVGGKRGQKFISPEIVHGLGLGKVFISLALEQEQEMLFGSSEIFEDFTPKAELAAKADIQRGSFVIGLRLLEATGQQTIRVRWRAVLEKNQEESSLTERKISIRPDKLEMKVRESYYLEAVTEGLPGAVILWEVKSRDGGTISRDGLYMAPNWPGVYEIQAWCQEIPQIRASLYVIVREN